MPKSLSKVHKHITKKKGSTTSLHANSRDARIILRASARDQKVAKASALRAHANQTYLDRLNFFKAHLFPTQDAPAQPRHLAEIQQLILQFLARHDQEMRNVKAARRPGRPPSAREAVLARIIESEKKEYASGFWLPDLTDLDNLHSLRRWDASWVGLGPLKFVRISHDGTSTQSCWPPGGKS